LIAATTISSSLWLFLRRGRDHELVDDEGGEARRQPERDRHVGDAVDRDARSPGSPPARSRWKAAEASSVREQHRRRIESTVDEDDPQPKSSREKPAGTARRCDEAGQLEQVLPLTTTM